MLPGTEVRIEWPEASADGVEGRRSARVPALHCGRNFVFICCWPNLNRNHWERGWTSVYTCCGHGPKVRAGCLRLVCSGLGLPTPNRAHFWKLDDSWNRAESWLGKPRSAIYQNSLPKITKN